MPPDIAMASTVSRCLFASVASRFLARWIAVAVQIVTVAKSANNRSVPRPHRKRRSFGLVDLSRDSMEVTRRFPHCAFYQQTLFPTWNDLRRLGGDERLSILNSAGLHRYASRYARQGSGLVGRKSPVRKRESQAGQYTKCHSDRQSTRRESLRSLEHACSLEANCLVRTRHARWCGTGPGAIRARSRSMVLPAGRYPPLCCELRSNGFFAYSAGTDRNGSNSCASVRRLPTART